MANICEILIVLSLFLIWTWAVWKHINKQKNERKN